MNDWFTIEKIAEDIVCISEYGHYEQTHSYLLPGAKKALLIDSGLGIGNIRDVVARYYAGPIDLVATHAHWDHIGGHALFENVFVHGAEEQWLRGNFPLKIDSVKKNLLKEGFRKAPPSEFDIDRYSIFEGRKVAAVEDGHVFDLGNRRIEVIHTPGHSPGHMCFLEHDKNFLFTGDLIYRGTIYVNYPTTDPLQYKTSINKITGLKLERPRLLPGHHDLDISSGLIDEMTGIIEELEKNGDYRSGSGLARGAGISILL